MPESPQTLSPRAAWLLSLLAPGLGHPRLAPGLAAALWLGFPAALLALFALGSWGVLGPAGWALGSAGCVLLWFGLLPLDAARRAREPTPSPPATRVVVGAASTALLALACLFALRLAVLEPFRAPSASMVPTLLVGDLFLATKGPLMRPLQRGDLVLFRRQGSVYVKRIAAVGGDRVGLRGGAVVLDGESLDRGPDGSFTWQDAHCVTRASPQRAEGSWSVLVDPADPGSSQDLGESEVAPGHLFVLGDNRGFSSDSRSFGLVSEADVVGLARWRIASYDGCERTWRPGRSGAF